MKYYLIKDSNANSKKMMFFLFLTEVLKIK